MESKRLAEVATWGHVGSIVVSLVWLCGYLMLVAAATTAVAVKLAKRAGGGRRGAAESA